MDLKRVCVVLSFAATLMIPFASLGGALEDGSTALERKDFKKAFSLLLPIARGGNTFAQYNIGVMYAQGLGVEKNDGEAAKWYRQAAQQGDLDAQSNLGLMYEKGRGVSQDYREAMKWYLMAAEKGSAPAQNNIGSLYFNGLAACRT